MWGGAALRRSHTSLNGLHKEEKRGIRVEKLLQVKQGVVMQMELEVC